MAITLNGTTGITTPALTSDGVVFADNTPSNTLVTDTSGNVGIGTNSPSTYGKLAVSGSIAMVPDNNGVLGVGRYSSGYGGSAISTNGGSTFLGIQVEGVEKLRVDSSGVFYFNSGYGSVAKAYGCRAWVNFNGTGTVAIRSSGNVSSITDNSTGDYTVNFTTAMPDANYSVLGTGQFPTPFNNVDGLVVLFRNTSTPLTTSSARISTGSTNNTFQDFPFVCAAIFR